MKFSKFAEIAFEFAGKIASDISGSANANGIAKGICAVLEVKGYKWIMNVPVVKPMLDYLAGMGIYNPEAAEAEQIDSETLIAFINGYAGTGEALQIKRVEIDNATLRALAQRLKEVANA